MVTTVRSMTIGGDIAIGAVSSMRRRRAGKHGQHEKLLVALVFAVLPSTAALAGPFNVAYDGSGFTGGHFVVDFTPEYTACMRAKGY